MSIEDTMACSAFAEAGEPCPIDPAPKTDAPESPEGGEKATSMSIKDTMACSAFAEAGEPCPIDTETKKD
jgi:hypothetical protein